MTTLPPELQSTYDVLEVMGGGMGTVYKVRHRLFGEVRIIKVMQTAIKDDQALKERFYAEAKRGKLLKHPNIAEVVDFAIGSDGNPHLVMEYVDGVNLREAFSRTGQPLDPRDVVAIGVQTLAALGYLHGRNLIHRDISPDNLMLTADQDGAPLVKLIDLGIAKSLEDTIALTQTGSFMGKLSYASPEQMGGAADPRSDFYSLGVVLYELLTATKPITGTSTAALMMAHYQSPPRPFSETDPQGRIPESLRRIVLKALAKNAEERYQNAGEFAEALRGALVSGDRPPAVTSTPWLTLSRATTESATSPLSDTRKVTMAPAPPQATQPATKPVAAPPRPPFTQPATSPGAHASAQHRPYPPDRSGAVADSYAIVEPIRAERKGPWQLIAAIACALLIAVVAIAGYEKLRGSSATPPIPVPQPIRDTGVTPGSTVEINGTKPTAQPVMQTSPQPTSFIVEPPPVIPPTTTTQVVASTTSPPLSTSTQPPEPAPTDTITKQPPAPRPDLVEGDRQRKRALALSNAHQWQSAVSAWRQFLHDYSGFNRLADHAAFYNLGVAYEALQNWREAIDAFEQAGKFDDTKSDTSNLLRLAHCYGKAGRWNDAVTTYEQVLRIDPSNEVAKKNLIPALQQAPRG